MKKRKKYSLDIGHAIKIKRIKKRLTQKELAEKIGIPSSYLSQLENRGRYPSEETLKKIAVGLETTSQNIIEEAKTIREEEGDSEILKVVKEMLTQFDIEDLKKAVEKIDKKL